MDLGANKPQDLPRIERGTFGFLRITRTSIVPKIPSEQAFFLKIRALSKVERN
jgi:hypothetical protein